MVIFFNNNNMQKQLTLSLTRYVNSLSNTALSRKPGPGHELKALLNNSIPPTKPTKTKNKK
jgi:hypothetical protein